jgi:CheY-like chemotaxis protein
MATWMVVEDEPDVYEMLLAMSQIWGIGGIVFVDGEGAVSWIDDVDNRSFHGELPELALIAIRLPGTTAGPMVGARLRNSPILGDIPIVLSTPSPLPPKTHQFMQEAGADRLIYQPLPGFGELRNMLEGMIADQQATAQSGRRKRP